ncbi:hypothetical protein [Streptomyces sp. YIM S03343]
MAALYAYDAEDARASGAKARTLIDDARTEAWAAKKELRAVPPTARLVWDWAQVAASCGALVWGWMKQRSDHSRALLDAPTPSESRYRKRQEKRRSTRFGYAGRGLLALAAPIMPAFAAYCVGWTVAMLTVREYPSEVGARLWLEKHQART